ncbi:MAG: molybdopterin-guanine dinucleotide biosynthesis protein B [Candidatus Latescibacterota bacterium]|nr:MAG: molybdopterin-guanine dinucleotide biosynthesis protein B [Candidatus Latescibacterota bacterium]
MTQPCYVRIAGAKNSGKTTLIVALTAEFTSHGYRVGTLKHTSHNHEFDRPGSDSFRHSAAGSAATIIVSPERFVLHAPRPADPQLLSLFDNIYDDCDIVFCEGHTDLSPTSGRAPLVECVAPGDNPLFEHDPDLVALVGDTIESTGSTNTTRVFARSDSNALAAWLRKRFGIKKNSKR